MTYTVKYTVRDVRCSETAWIYLDNNPIKIGIYGVLKTSTEVLRREIGPETTLLSLRVLPETLVRKLS